MANYSALHYSEKARKYAELSQQYANDKLNLTSITNCLINVPQNYKLELLNNVLTLKTGSVVYFPSGFYSDGSLKFDKITTTKDISMSGSVINSTSDVLLYLIANSTVLRGRAIERSYSGTEKPSTTYSAWYNTSENKIYDFEADANTPTRQLSLPIAYVKFNKDGTINSIEQVFNGFGYMGSTTFSLPNVEGLSPNGRNNDNSLKSEIYKTAKVLTKTYAASVNMTNVDIFFNSAQFGDITEIRYNKESNLFVWNDGRKVNCCLVGTITVASGRITDFNIKNIFRAVDHYDLNTLTNNFNTSLSNVNSSLNTLTNNFNTLDKQNVKVFGDQTINGDKTFSGNTTLSGLNVTGNSNISGDIIRKINIDLSTNPASAMYLIPFAVDNADQSLKSYQQISYLTNGTIRNTFGLRRTVNGSNVFNSIDIGIDSAGNRSINVNTPETNNNSSEIATTAFVKSVLSSSGNGLATLISNDNGNAIKFSNGLTIQWGSYEQTGNNSVTFPTAFNSTNYTISICGLQDVTSSSTGANISDIAIRSKTTTGFISNHLNRNRTNMYLVIGY